MRLLWFIIVGIALWYLGKALYRYYLGGPTDRKRSDGIERENDPGTSARSTERFDYDDAHDAKFRDLE